MTRILTYVVAGVIALTSGIHTATAANKKPEVRCSSHQPAKVELACGYRALRSNRSAARWIKNHRTLAVVVEHRTAHGLRYYVWREKVAHRWIKQAYVRLHPRVVVVSGIAHQALWLCIHKGEGAWNDNTGNGYYGGLQMTSGWGGVKRPDLLSPAAQMALAERGLQAAIRKGTEFDWLRQQWPNTSPPCLGYAG